MDYGDEDAERAAEDRIAEELVDRRREAASPKRGGGRLNRSETVTVRLDPRLNYLCELAARAQRRTKSSFIEWAVETALNAVVVPGTSDFHNNPQSIDDLANSLWDVDEADRLANLAFNAPILMTHEEQVLWKTACSYGYVWRGRYHSIGEDEEEWVYNIAPDKLIRDRFRETFDQLKLTAQGDAKISELPGYLKRRSKKAPPITFDDDSDVPF